MRYLKHWVVNYAVWVGLYLVYATGALLLNLDDKPFWGHGGPAWILLPLVGVAAVTALVTQKKPLRRPPSGKRR